MLTLKLENAADNKVRAIIFEICEKNSTASILDIMEIEEDRKLELGGLLTEWYPNLAGVYLGSDQVSHKHAGATIVAERFAVLIPDACDLFELALSELTA